MIEDQMLINERDTLAIRRELYQLTSVNEFPSYQIQNGHRGKLNIQ